MSKSATLYRVSKDTFEQLKSSDNSRKFDSSSTKSFATFQGSFVGLEYILTKGQDQLTTELLSEIFNPKEALGRQKFESLTPEEQFEFYESGSFIPYLDTTEISEINDLLDGVKGADIHAKYDAKEFNSNGIYPSVWHNDNSPDQAINKRHLLEDLTKLKTIIMQADQDKDFILVFVG
jgi:Domain of unknown function (DUF1877)